MSAHPIAGPDQMAERLRRLSERLPPGGEPPDNGGMEARIAKLETELAVVRSNHATKEDVTRVEVKIVEAKNSVIMWVVSAILLAQVLPGILKKFGL